MARMVVWRQFHMSGPATEKARLPNCVLLRLTAVARVVEERSWRTFKSAEANRTRGALQIQDRSPQSRNGRPVASCNGKFSRERPATARPVAYFGRLRPVAYETGLGFATRPMLYYLKQLTLLNHDLINFGNIKISKI